jgi:dTDP-4-amino-4,6-dideoxygalactose transaminase
MGILAVNGGEPMRTQPFPSWPVFGAEEEKNLLEVLHSGNWWYGQRVREFERRFAEFQNAKYGVSCSNGTTAIQLSLRTLGIGAGDEALVPAYTFLATATAVLDVNAIPVFVDIEEDTLNMDLNEAERLVTEKTRAIVVVHFAGLPADMDRANELGEKYGLRVVEDAAHGWGTQWKGKGAGALGEMGTFSLQQSKNITSAEGGMILTDHEEYAAVARSLSNCGRVEGHAWYDSPRLGGNYRLTEFQAAVLLAQLDRLEAQTVKREANAAILDEELAKVPGVKPMRRDERVTRRSWHLYPFRFISSEFGGLSRDEFVGALSAEGIPASPGYLTPVYGNGGFLELSSARGKENCPLSCPYYGKEMDYHSVHCAVAERLCREEMVWLGHPMLLGDAEDMHDIVGAVRKIHENQGELS